MELTRVEESGDVSREAWDDLLNHKWPDPSPVTERISTAGINDGFWDRFLSGVPSALCHYHRKSELPASYGGLLAVSPTAIRADGSVVPTLADPPKPPAK